MRLDALHARVPPPNGTRRIPLGETFALDRAKEHVEVLAGDVGAARILRPGVAERLVAAHDRLG